nr:MAG TPA: hypothetical protein [Caudoviricetes sp.]
MVTSFLFCFIEKLTRGIFHIETVTLFPVTRVRIIYIWRI